MCVCLGLCVTADVQVALPNINPSKKVWKSVSDRSFLCCYCGISIEFYIIGKPVHFPLQ